MSDQREKLRQSVLVDLLNTPDELVELAARLRVELAALDTDAPLELAVQSPNLAVVLFGHSSEADQMEARKEFAKWAKGYSQ